MTRRKIYVMGVDQMILPLEGMTEDDYVVMVSDHGCSPVNRIAYMERFLYDRGFLVFKDPATPKTCFVPGWYDKIDWEEEQGVVP